MARAKRVAATKERPIELPEKIRIGYRTIRVEWLDIIEATDAAPGGICGDWDRFRGLIRVSEHLPAEEAQNTLLHEVLHACLSVADAGIEPAAEEHIVNKLANVLTQVLHDNPALVQAIAVPVDG